jgi:hypothetical protein
VKTFKFLADEASRVEIGPTSNSIGEVMIPAEHYQVDLELLDRYQAFSSELLRISLGGVAVIGFLISSIIGDKGLAAANAALAWFKFFAFASAVFFCFSAAASLCHRYFATDGVYYHVKAIRLRLFRTQAGGLTMQTEEGLDNAVRSRKAIYRFSGRFLFAASLLLWIGVVFLATSFAFALLLIKPSS